MAFNKKLTFEGLQYYHSKIKTLFSNVNKTISDETTRATTKENEITNNLSVLETNLGDLKKEEVDNKIESEVATDFSQADTPQFQQTIDDALNEVSELKGDLVNLKNNISVKYEVLDKGEPVTNSAILEEDGKVNIRDNFDKHYGYYKIEVSKNKRYKLFGYNIQSLRMYFLTDDENNIILKSNNTVDSFNGYIPENAEFVTPSNAKWLYFNFCDIDKQVYGQESNITYDFGAIVSVESSENKSIIYTNYWNNGRIRYNKLMFYKDESEGYELEIIPVSAGDKYFIRCHNYYELVGYVYINDKGENIKSSYDDFTSQLTYRAWGNYLVDVLEDGYIICSTSKGLDKLYISKVKNDKLFGKKWYAIGDSFTEFYPEHDRNSQVNYVDIVAGTLGLEVNNVGVGGTGYRAPAPGESVNTFVSKALGCKGYDIVSLYGSFNDSATRMPIGTVTDTGTDTLAGRMYNAINNIRITEPNATIIVIAPAPWISNNSVTGCSWGSDYIHPDTYVEMLKNICKRYNVMFVNTYSDGGAFPWLWETGRGEDDFNHTYLYDKTHYSAYGHEKFIAPLVIDAIQKSLI